MWTGGDVSPCCDIIALASQLKRNVDEENVEATVICSKALKAQLKTYALQKLILKRYRPEIDPYTEINSVQRRHEKQSMTPKDQAGRSSMITTAASTCSKMKPAKVRMLGPC